jgi:hypothetical protein
MVVHADSMLPEIRLFDIGLFKQYAPAYLLLEKITCKDVNRKSYKSVGMRIGTKFESTECLREAEVFLVVALKL